MDWFIGQDMNLGRPSEARLADGLDEGPPIGFKKPLIGGNYLFGTVLGNQFDILSGLRSAVNGLNTVTPESPYAYAYAYAFGISAPQGCYLCTFGEFRVEQLEVSKVPLPAGVLLLGLGLGGLAAYRRRQSA